MERKYVTNNSFCSLNMLRTLLAGIWHISDVDCIATYWPNLSIVDCVFRGILATKRLVKEFLVNGGGESTPKNTCVSEGLTYNMNHYLCNHLLYDFWFTYYPCTSLGAQTLGSRALSCVGSFRAWLTCCLLVCRRATWRVVKALWRILTLWSLPKRSRLSSRTSCLPVCFPRVWWRPALPAFSIMSKTKSKAPTSWSALECSGSTWACCRSKCGHHRLSLIQPWREPTNWTMLKRRSATYVVTLKWMSFKKSVCFNYLFYIHGTFHM